MKLFALTLLAMLAFAANSVLNRLALAGELIDPASFAVIRLFSGAIILGLIVLAQSSTRPALLSTKRGVSVAALLAYMLGFSFAYLSLDTGVGALVLFGGVQITMFAGALLAREHVPALKWIGALVAAGGLAWFRSGRPSGRGVDGHRGARLGNLFTPRSRCTKCHRGYRSKLRAGSSAQPARSLRHRARVDPSRRLAGLPVRHCYVWARLCTLVRYPAPYHLSHRGHRTSPRLAASRCSARI